MRRRKLVILLAALIFGLAACAKPAEPSPVAVSSVLALSSEQSAPAQTPEGQEKPAEPEHEWTQEDIRRMYQNIQEPQDADFAYLGDGAVTFRLQSDDAAEYDYTLTLEKTGEGVNWTAKDSLTVPNP